MNSGTTCIFYQVCNNGNGFVLRGVKFSENRPSNRSLNKKEKKTPCQKVALFCNFPSLSCNFYRLNCKFLKFSFLMCYVLTKVLSLSPKNEKYGIHQTNEQGQQRSLHQPEQGCIIYSKRAWNKNPLCQRSDSGGEGIFEKGAIPSGTQCSGCPPLMVMLPTG